MDRQKNKNPENDQRFRLLNQQGNANLSQNYNYKNNYNRTNANNLEFGEEFACEECKDTRRNRESRDNNYQKDSTVEFAKEFKEKK